MARESPLQALLEAMRAVEAGDLTVRLPRAPEDPERDALAQAFNGMMERAFRLRGEALAQMGHELRTPLHSLLLLARVLAENPEGNLTPRQVEYASTVLSSGQELLGLLDELLDLTKAEAGKLRVEPRDLVLRELLPPLESAFRPMAEQKGVAFHVEVRPDAPALLHTDPRRVQQVLRNLLINALKFTHAGEVRLTVEAAPGGVAFSVSDTGIGIPEEQQQRVFEAFQQADGGTSRRYGGTGLGLAISRELAHRLGGALSLRSAPGQGSTFTLSLPLTPVRSVADGEGEP
jgi:signal transduction histidine kinase